jgi:hypothetical protein
MCLNPSKIADVGFVACRECWQCRERKVDDWVGRNIAESKTAKEAVKIELTYGYDRTYGSIAHIRAAVLTYSDVQKMLKNLRISGFPCRYFVVGEYGSLKGRAHWHILIYWLDKVPEYKMLTEKYSWRWWPHGFAYFKPMGQHSVRYACKYILKDPEDPAKQSWGPQPSKLPPLGDAYFRRLAHRYVEAGLAPQNYFYSFDDVRRVPHGTKAKTAKGLRDSAQPIQFRMSGKTAENFARYFCEEWERVHPDRAPPASEVVSDYYNRRGSYASSVVIDEYFPWRPGPRPHAPPRGGTGPYFDEHRNVFYSDLDGRRYYWSYNKEGDLEWHEKIGHDPAKERLREARFEAAVRANSIARYQGR